MQEYSFAWPSAILCICLYPLRRLLPDSDSACLLEAVLAQSPADTSKSCSVPTFKHLSPLPSGLCPY